jgi:ABC-2 type transport system permease protein
MRTLTTVELRKAVDTRAGFWLQAATAAITAAAVAILCIVGDHSDRELTSVLALAVQPANILLPVAGILLVSSEWSQRTSLITFTLVPRRQRVLIAKLLAALVLSLAAFAVCLSLSLAATAISGGAMHLPAARLGQMAFFTVTSMLIGVGFGAALQSSAPAIVLSFAAPVAISAIGSIHAIEGGVRWIDQARSLAPLTDRVFSADDWAHATTTLALWLLLPLGIGAWRLARGEIR